MRHEMAKRTTKRMKFYGVVFYGNFFGPRWNREGSRDQLESKQARRFLLRPGVVRFNFNSPRDDIMRARMPFH